MTTLTTPLMPLTLSRLTTCNELTTLNGNHIKIPNVMHPDRLILQDHGITSPRLSSSDSANSINDSIIETKDLSDCDMKNSPKYYNNNYNNNIKNNSILYNRKRSELQSNTNSTDDCDISDRLSCYSDDSELSVGQEESLQNNHNKNNYSITMNQITDECESIENGSILSEENRLTSNSTDHLAGDEASNDSSNNHDNIIDPLLITKTIRIPTAPAIIRPSPTRLQEEFLRKSHIYAEELMKQQMQFMAVAHASAYSLRNGIINNENEQRIGFRPHIKQLTNVTNFSGIHSHLDALSKLSTPLNRFSTLNNNNNNNNNNIQDSFKTSQAFNNLHHNPFINNNLNETTLKFSIDNILKADFGRRITEPILKRNSSNSSSSSSNSSISSNSSCNNKYINNRKTSLNRNIDKQSIPIDLTHAITTTTTTTTSQNIIRSKTTTNSASVSLINSNNCLNSDEQIINDTCSIVNATQSQLSAISTTPTTTTSSTTDSSSSNSNNNNNGNNSSIRPSPMEWPAWVYCTRYSDRPSSGPRTRKPKKAPSEKSVSSSDEKRPRTAFSGPQLARLKHEFNENRYLTEKRRQQLSAELGLNEAQIKIWFQNKRAKIKKASGTKNPLALQLMAQGLYNHSTVPLTREEEELQELQANAGE